MEGPIEHQKREIEDKDGETCQTSDVVKLVNELLVSSLEFLPEKSQSLVDGGHGWEVVIAERRVEEEELEDGEESSEGKA